MSDAARLSLFRASQFAQMLRKAALESDLVRNARLIVTLGAVVLAGVCTGAAVFFLVVPALVLLTPVLLVVTVLSTLWGRRNQDSSVVAQVGVWSVVSDRYKSDVFERLE